jgi:surface antigen
MAPQFIGAVQQFIAKRLAAGPGLPSETATTATLSRGVHLQVSRFAARFALVVSCGLMTAAPASAQFWQCVTFARSISGIQIRGNAKTWWNQAASRYARGHAPKVGAVLAFEATRRMRLGHVAMVSEVVSAREIRLTHANWSRPGRVERDARAIDVSPAGDWSAVKVQFGGAMGTSIYPTNGFIYSGRADGTETLAANKADAARG